MTPCDKIQEQLSAYVDREIDAQQARAIAAHLEQCASCLEAANAESAIKTLVHERAQSYAAPASLRSRIRRNLDSIRARFGFWRLVRELWTFHPVPAFAAVAALVLASSALTFLGNNAFATLENPVAFESNVRLVGNLVCADCQLMMITKTPCIHDAAAHRLVLKCEDGKLWNIVQSPQGLALLQGLGAETSVVQTEGYLFRAAGYIQVTDFKFLQN
jgi:anti-sigma factor (TIGR02949 family)